jgi:hypothetical protein
VQKLIKLYLTKELAQHSILKLWTFITIHMPNTYKLLDDPSKTLSLHIIICMKQNMLFELCVGNYATFDGLVNGANGIFKTSVSYQNKTKMWISFPNKKIGMLFREKSIHFYTKKFN